MPSENYCIYDPRDNYIGWNTHAHRWNRAIHHRAQCSQTLDRSAVDMSDRIAGTAIRPSHSTDDKTTACA
eukprot:3613139-Alexandrium_andersonii.AAC.1